MSFADGLLLPWPGTLVLKEGQLTVNSTYFEDLDVFRVLFEVMGSKFVKIFDDSSFVSYIGRNLLFYPISQYLGCASYVAKTHWRVNS